VLLAAPDTLHFSADIQLSDELHEKLEREKLAAQEADKANAVHCPDWLGAQVLPHGARGGYGLLLETDDFSVKVLGKDIPNRPGLFVELRSHFLHTHPQGPQAACEEALCWLRSHLLYDQDEQTNRSRWPMDPAWIVLHEQYGPLANAAPLDEESQVIVWGARYTGKSRLLRRMLLGVVGSLEVEDASPTAASLAALHRWVDKLAAKEAERAQARRARYQNKYGAVPEWVEQGMGARLQRVEQVRHRVQMLLGIFAARDFFCVPCEKTT